VNQTSAVASTLTPAIGRELLDELGFLHVPGPPLSASRAYLFIALRRKPTLRHFDPERIDYWSASGPVGSRATIAVREPLPAVGEYEWGQISIVDRLNVANDYVSFGGQLSVERTNGLMVAVFSSDAPILARGGRSQGWDPLAEEAAGHIARLRAAVGRSRALEASALDCPPVALYSAFVIDELAREGAAARVVDWHPQSRALLRREARRLSTERPLDWATGDDLARQLAGGGVAA
jgi:hypothetical protein